MLTIQLWSFNAIEGKQFNVIIMQKNILYKNKLLYLIHNKFHVLYCLAQPSLLAGERIPIFFTDSVESDDGVLVLAVLTVVFFEVVAIKVLFAVVAIVFLDVLTVSAFATDAVEVLVAGFALVFVVLMAVVVFAAVAMEVLVAAALVDTMAI